MNELRIATTDGAESTVSAVSLADFSKRVRGPVLRPESEGYEGARRVWNGIVDRKPALIVQCSNTDDVAHSIRFARDNRLLISVRGGGHNIRGTSVCDRGMMIDLSLMKAIRVDAEAKRAF